MTYFNTTHVEGEQLDLYKEQAVSQEDEILHFFRRRPDELYSRESLHKVVLVGAPTSSLCRALSNLKDSGDLVKTGQQVRGQYGRPVYCWRLA